MSERRVLEQQALSFIASWEKLRQWIIVTEEKRLASEKHSTSEIRAYLAESEDTDMLPHDYVRMLEGDARRLLDAAVKLRAALSYRIMRAGTPEQLREAEDALMADTAWVADSTDGD